jgi:hypothetical protein
VPFNPSLFSMTCHTADPDGSGDAFVSDMTGLSVNQRRILVLAQQGLAEGSTEPERTVSNTSYG